MQAPGENFALKEGALLTFRFSSHSVASPLICPLPGCLTTPQPAHAVLSLQTTSGTPKNGALITINLLLFSFN